MTPQFDTISRGGIIFQVNGAFWDDLISLTWGGGICDKEVPLFSYTLLSPWMTDVLIGLSHKENAF